MNARDKYIDIKNLRQALLREIREERPLLPRDSLKHYLIEYYFSRGNKSVFSASTDEAENAREIILARIDRLAEKIKSKHSLENHESQESILFITSLDNLAPKNQERILAKLSQVVIDQLALRSMPQRILYSSTVTLGNPLIYSRVSVKVLAEYYRGNAVRAIRQDVGFFWGSYSSGDYAILWLFYHCLAMSDNLGDFGSSPIYQLINLASMLDVLGHGQEAFLPQILENSAALQLQKDDEKLLRSCSDILFNDNILDLFKREGERRGPSMLPDVSALLGCNASNHEPVLVGSSSLYQQSVGDLEGASRQPSWTLY